MEVLFLLGNGFDINLKLPTDYQSFYDDYLNQESSSDLVSVLKGYLSQERYQTWADLEWGLGQYTTQVKTVEDLEVIYFDLSDHLRTYLHNLAKSFEPTAPMKEVIFRGLSGPHFFLPDGMKREIVSFIGGNQRNVNVISFNYTDTFERIVGFGEKTVSYPIQLDRYAVLNSIRHIHMSLADSDFIMGVNDENQIRNQNMLNDAYRNLLVKPHINQQLQNLVDEECLRLIGQADLICLFGLSLGKTDLMWWEAIGKRMMTSHARLIYFVYDKTKVTRNSRIIGKMQESRTLLLERFGIEKNQDQNDLLKRIYIGYNTKVFRVGE